LGQAVQCSSLSLQAPVLAGRRPFGDGDTAWCQNRANRQTGKKKSCNCNNGRLGLRKSITGFHLVAIPSSAPWLPATRLWVAWALEIWALGSGSGTMGTQAAGSGAWDLGVGDAGHARGSGADGSASARRGPAGCGAGRAAVGPSCGRAVSGRRPASCALRACGRARCARAPAGLAAAGCGGGHPREREGSEVRGGLGFEGSIYTKVSIRIWAKLMGHVGLKSPQTKKLMRVCLTRGYAGMGTTVPHPYPPYPLGKGFSPLTYPRVQNQFHTRLLIG
jgi:hypothetical protein